MRRTIKAGATKTVNVTIKNPGSSPRRSSSIRG